MTDMQTVPATFKHGCQQQHHRQPGVTRTTEPILCQCLCGLIRVELVVVNLQSGDALGISLHCFGRGTLALPVLPQLGVCVGVTMVRSLQSDDRPQACNPASSHSHTCHSHTLRMRCP